MDEVTAVSVDAEVIIFKTSTLFGFILRVIFVVFSEFIQSMCEFASFFVGTVTYFHIFFAELGFLFVALKLD